MLCSCGSTFSWKNIVQYNNWIKLYLFSVSDLKFQSCRMELSYFSIFTFSYYSANRNKLIEMMKNKKNNRTRRNEFAIQAYHENISGDIIVDRNVLFSVAFLNEQSINIFIFSGEI